MTSGIENKRWAAQANTCCAPRLTRSFVSSPVDALVNLVGAVPIVRKNPGAMSTPPCRIAVVLRAQRCAMAFAHSPGRRGGPRLVLYTDDFLQFQHFINLILAETRLQWTTMPQGVARPCQWPSGGKWPNMMPQRPSPGGRACAATPTPSISLGSRSAAAPACVSTRLFLPVRPLSA